MGRDGYVGLVRWRTAVMQRDAGILENGHSTHHLLVRSSICLLRKRINTMAMKPGRETGLNHTLDYSSLVFVLFIFPWLKVQLCDMLVLKTHPGPKEASLSCNVARR